MTITFLAVDLEMNDASELAYAQAGIDDLREQLDVAERYMPFPSFEYPMVEAADLCDPCVSAGADAEGEFGWRTV